MTDPLKMALFPYLIIMSMLEAGIAISKMDTKKSTGCDGVSIRLVTFALPYAIDTLTLIYNLCYFPTIFKRAMVYSTPHNIDHFL